MNTFKIITMSKRKRILFDRDDMDFINEMKAREHSNRVETQMSATVFALACLGGAGYLANSYPKLAMACFVAAFVFGIISFFADPDK